MSFGHPGRLFTAAALASVMLLSASLPAVSDDDVVTAMTGEGGNINAPDLNADGHPDLVIVEFGTDWVAVRINDGHGGFRPPTRYRAGIGPSFIAIGDFDANSRLDLAISNARSADVSVLLGNGDGTLQPAKNYQISEPGHGPSNGTFALVAQDFNHDGRLDVATSNSSSNDVSVLLGHGDGTMAAAKVYPLLGAHSVGVIPFSLAEGDFNSDGNPDLVSGGALSDTVLLGHPDGSFTAVASNTVGFSIPCVNVADVNRDGVLDVVATAWEPPIAKVLLGVGDGTFRDGETANSLGTTAECFTIADLNQDRLVDLAIANTSSADGVGNMAVLLGSGNGHFDGDLTRSTYPVMFTPWATAVADYDGDGLVDVAVVNGSPASVSLLRGNGDGTFQPQVLYPM